MIQRLRDWLDSPDFTISNEPMADEPTIVMGIKHLAHRWGCRIDLHTMINADGVNRFHTHPAWAIRVVVVGGYEEEVHDYETGEGYLQTWRPGAVGVVEPSFCHRLHRLLNGRYSRSLWLRGPIVRNTWIGGYVGGRMKLEELGHKEI